MQSNQFLDFQGILFVGYIVDNFISSHIVKSFNDVGYKLEKDNTEEITERVKEVLKNKSLLHRRLVNAYPNVKNLKVKISKRRKERLDKIKDIIKEGKQNDKRNNK